MRRANLFKIGISRDSWRRFKTVIGNDPAGALLHTITTREARRIEKRLHRVFAEKHSHDEWFHLDPEDVALIRTVGDCPTVWDLPEPLRPKPEHARDREQPAAGAPTVQPQRKRGNRLNVVDVFIGIRESLRERLDAFAQANGRDRYCEIELAMRRHVYWPPHSLNDPAIRDAQASAVSTHAMPDVNTLMRFDKLRETMGRSRQEELELAIERHLAYPPPGVEKMPMGDARERAETN